MDEVSAEGARDTDCCRQASSDDECSNDSKSLFSAQGSTTPTTAASIKNKESTAPLKKGSSSLSFSTASTSKRAPSRMGSDDDGDWGVLHCDAAWKNQPFAWESQPTGDRLEQRIGKRTHRLRKPTQPTDDAADKSMIPESDLVERSTSYSGNDLVVQEKQKLDLSAILAGEPKGSWRRSIGA